MPEPDAVTGLPDQPRLDRLRALIDPSVGRVPDLAAYVPAPGAEALGIVRAGPGEALVRLTDPARPVGALQIEAHGRDNLVLIDNAAAAGPLHGTLRMLGSGGTVWLGGAGADGAVLHQVFLRGDEQVFAFGPGGTAVGLVVEIEGRGRAVCIGEDALIASGVWIRNHDMHAVFDAATRRRVNADPVDTVLERHVWLGQDTLLLSCERVGLGAVIGAKALVKRRVPRLASVGGVPARVLRRGVTWGRHPYELMPHEAMLLDA